VAQNLRLLFRDGLSSLHDIGYLSVDVYQLVAFSQTLAEENVAEAERWFGENARPFNRFAPVLERYARMPAVTDARRGSIELWMEVANLAAAIIVPLVAVYVQREIGNPKINFEIGAVLGAAEVRQLHALLLELRSAGILTARKQSANRPYAAPMQSWQQ